MVYQPIVEVNYELKNKSFLFDAEIESEKGRLSTPFPDLLVPVLLQLPVCLQHLKVEAAELVLDLSDVGIPYMVD